MAAPISCARRSPTSLFWRCPQNLGFGGGSNAGFRAAKNDIVVLLNSDMRVAPDFLAPLLEGFRDPEVFAVSCQIFFTDPAKVREETGLTQGWWQDGSLRVRHRIDDAVDDLFPCFYGGGGSCAFDRSQVSRARRIRPVCWSPSTWKTPTSATWRGSADGRCCTSRAAWYSTSTGARSARSSRRSRSRPSSRRITCCSAGRIFTSGRAWYRTFSSPGRALFWPSCSATFRCGRTSHALWWAFRAASAGFAVAPARAGAGGDQRHGGIQAAAGRLLPRSLRRHGARSRAAARAVCFALPDLPARPRRRRLHVPDAARDGEAGGSSHRRTAGLAVAGSGQRGIAHLLRLGRVAGAAQRAAQGHGIAGTARGSRVRQRRSRMADPPADLLQADRYAATRVHADGAVPRRVPADRHGAVRARCLLPIHRARPGPHDRRLRRDEGARRIPARAALRTRRAARLRPGAGLHAGESRLPAQLPSRTGCAHACGSARRHRYQPVFVPSARARAADHAVPRQLAS